MADGGGMTVDRLQIEIEASTQKATDGINKQIEALNRLKSATNGFGNPTHKISVDSKDVDKATQGVSKLTELMGSLKRIAMYRLIRTAIKEITQAFKEGLENAYEFSKATGGKIAPALDSIASAGAKLKNQLGALFGELLVALEPIITALAEIVTLLAEALTAFVSLFSGEFLKANDVSVAWGEANKKAKEYKRTLIGIDEINRLNDGKTPDGTAFSSYNTTFNWPDMEEKWLKPFISDLDDGTAKMKELVTATEELAAVPQPVFQLDAEPALVTIHALEGELAAVPEYVPELAFEPVPQPVIESVTMLEAALEGLRTILLPLLEAFPVLLTFKVENPVPVLSQITVGIMEQVAQWQAAFAQIPAYVSSAFEKVGQALDAFQQRYEQFKITSEEYNRAIDSNIDRYIQSAYQTIKTFFDNIVQTANQWGPELLASITITFAEIVTKMNPGLVGARERISGWLTETFKNFNNWGESIVEFFKNVWETINNVVSGIKNAINEVRNSTVGKFLFGEQKQRDLSTGWSTIPAIPMATMPIPVFASGGFVDSGQLFLANEAGPELVGTIGGQTAVANSGQIVDGISEGVAYANSGVIGAINQLIAVVQQIDPTVELDGLTVSRQLHKYNRQVTKEAGGTLVMEAMA